MAWFRIGGAGISAALKTAMNAVLNKKFGTVLQDYAPETWPDTVNLMGPLEEKTVSGSVVAFSDGADDVPLKSCAVTIAPTLDGVSSVSVVRQGKNIYGLVPYQATGSNTPAFSDCMFIKAGQYVFSFGELSDGENTASNWRYAVTVYDTDGTLNETDSPNTSALPYRAALYSFASPVNSAQKSIILTFTKDCYIFMRFWSGETTSSMEMTNPMLEVGSTASAYEPYVTPTTHTATLGRTIYGGEVDVVQGTGTDENGNDFTFTPVPIITRLGDNTLWSDGDLSVIYRSMGTVYQYTEGEEVYF